MVAFSEKGLAVGWHTKEGKIMRILKREISVPLMIVLFLGLSIGALASSDRIMPEHFEYLGAFLTPAWIPGTPDAQSWEWGGMSMAYDASGDVQGKTDDFPGSIYGTGHDVWNLVSEIDIPVPVISSTKNLSHLNTARTIQGFSDVKKDLFTWIEEMPRVGLEILSPQGEQTVRRLYLCWGAHHQDEFFFTHMWCETDLQNPYPAGAWTISGMNPYNANDYLFEIPSDWAEENVSGMRLATGRYRDGGWSGFGPSLMAIAPWKHGNPPPHRAVLESIPLIKYSNYFEGNPDPWHQMNGYSHSDEWTGGAWLTAGDRSAVVFVGTKGIGDAWYGDPLKECMDDCELPHLRGWWSNSFEGWFIFYDTSDLAKVAQGLMQPYEAQPYAHLNVDDVLYYVYGDQEKYHLGACSYDRDNNLFYVFEPGRESPHGEREEERTIVHVWRIRSK